MRSNNLIEFTNYHLPMNCILLFSTSANFQKSSGYQGFKSILRGELIITNKELVFFKKTRFNEVKYQVPLKKILFASCAQGMRGSTLIIKTEQQEYSFDLLNKEKVSEFINTFENETEVKVEIPEKKNNTFLRVLQVILSLALLGFIISSVITDVEPVIDQINQTQE